MKRRDLMLSAIGAACLLPGSSSVSGAANAQKPAFVLVHGAWHGAWCFSGLIPYLQAAGHVVYAQDLPGHGGRARYPKSFGWGPIDAAVFATEPSPVATISLDEYVSSIVKTIDLHISTGTGPVVLVGHSMGGIPITAIGEAVPEKIKRLIYLTAYMPASGIPAVAYFGTPEAEGGKAGALLRSDPLKTGALRLNPRSPDPIYQAGLKETFAGDMLVEEWEVVRNLLSPDAPFGPFKTSIATSRSRWGSIPRAYIKCQNDLALRPKVQSRFIELADAFTPDNRTVVEEIDSSHSPFFSHPEKLAAILSSLA